MQHSYATQAAVVVMLLAATGCVSNRNGAKALADAGVSASSALAQELQARSERIANKIIAQNFNYAYSTMRNCQSASGWNITIADGPQPICDVLTVANGRTNAAVTQRFAKLSGIIRLRAQAVQSLTEAYQALGAEAEYNARGDMEDALSSATAAATNLGSALGLGPVPQLVTTGIKLGGGLLADHAQQRRLQTGSAQLQAVTRYLKIALQEERALYAETEALAGDVEAETRRHLATAGLLPVTPALQDVIEAVAFPKLDESALTHALANDARLRAAAQVSALSQIGPVTDPAFTEAIKMLGELEREHGAFQAKQRLSLAELTASIERLTEIVEASRASKKKKD